MAHLKRTKSPIDNWLLYIGFAVALASLVLIDHSNNSRIGAALFAQLRNLISPPVSQVEGAFAEAPTIAPRIAQPQRAAIAPPTGWEAVVLPSGVTVYQAPQDITAQPGSTLDNEDRGVFYVDPLDGTREPYLTEIKPDDLLKNEIAPQQYAWRGIWQGEGYTRELENDGWLIARQEGGNNIFLSVNYDASITNPSQPNLTITIESTQDRTAQLTNISAFQYNSAGKLVQRRDFPQLPPFYDVSVTLSGETEMKQLRPLGSVTYAYHVNKDELGDRLPMTLEAVNQFVDERNQQIAALEAAGWIVKEVPAPRQ